MLSIVRGKSMHPAHTECMFNMVLYIGMTGRASLESRWVRASVKELDPRNHRCLYRMIKDDARMNPCTNGPIMSEGHAPAKDCRAAWCLLG